MSARSYKFEVVVEAAGKVHIEQITDDEKAALERADYLLGLAKFTAVRVIRIDRRGGEKTIFEKGYAGGGRLTTVSALHDAAVCDSLADIYGFASRRTLVRLLRSYCDEQGLIPCQMLHRALLLRQLEREQTLFAQAVSRLAALQARRLQVKPEARAEILYGFHRELLEKAKTADTLEPFFAILASQGLVALLDETALTLPAEERDRAVTYALARALEMAGDWGDKLRVLCELSDRAATPEAVRTLDELIAEVLDGSAPIKAVIGYAPDLAAALGALLAISEGRLDDRMPGTPPARTLSRLMGRIDLPVTRGVLIERIAKSLDGQVNLTRQDRSTEAAAFRALLERLQEYGGVKGGPAMAAAITRRAKLALAKGDDNLPFERAVAEILALLPRPAAKAGYILELLATESGRRHATPLIGLLARIFTEARAIWDFMPADGSGGIAVMVQGFKGRLSQGGIPEDLAQRFMRRLEVLALSAGSAPPPGAAAARPEALAVRSVEETVEIRRPRSSATAAAAAPVTQLQLSYGGQDYRCPATAAKFVLGRGTDCDVVVPFEGTSRAHAVIVPENGRFVIADQSLNGTYVLIDGYDPVVLHKQALELIGTGTIFLGADPDFSIEGRPHLIHFRCPDPA